MKSTRVKALFPHRQHMHDYGSLLFWILTVGHRCSNRDQTLKAACYAKAHTDDPQFLLFHQTDLGHPIEHSARHPAHMLSRSVATPVKPRRRYTRESPASSLSKDAWCNPTCDGG